MEKIKTINKTRLKKILKNPDTSGLAYKKYGKSENIDDYSEREINEMVLGIYRDKHYLLVDGDYYINLDEIKRSECFLEDVTYHKKPTLDTFKDNSCNIISNIRTFYIKNYYLITEDSKGEITKHRITKYLYKVGFLNAGRGKYSGLYSIANDYATMQGGLFPKDLYHPIKRFVNGLFYNDDYKISDFKVISSLKITAN